MDLPKYIPTNKTGRRGLNVLTKIVENELGWIVRKNHQEDDFGIDAFFDITINDHYITGKSIAVQIKSGKSYLNELDSNFWAFKGKTKHLNYYLNHDNPVLIVLVDLEAEIAYWEICKIKNVKLQGNSWTMQIPKNQQICLNQKEKLLKYVSKNVDYIAQLEERLKKRQNNNDVKISEISQRHLTYNTLLILNEETNYFNVYIPDLAVFAEGKTKEEVISDLLEIMENYTALAIKYEAHLPKPSPIDDIKNEWTGYDVFSIVINISTGKSFYADPFGTVNI